MSYRICENGKYRDMTPEEIEEMERRAAELPEPELTPTNEERIAELEEALELLLSGVTE